MAEYRLGAVEARFADLIWANAPISSGELVKLCEKELDWKKSTTYTVLKRLCQRGLFENLSPARDNAFFYTMGKTMQNSQIDTVYN